MAFAAGVYPGTNRLRVGDYAVFIGGAHVGGTVDPGTDNLIVDGTSTLTGRLIVNGCPSSFTHIGFGCLQTAEEGTDTYVDALSNCNSNYGGRLPFQREEYIGFTEYALTDEGDDEEWIFDAYSLGGENCMTNAIDTYGSNSLGVEPGYLCTSGTQAYRCYVPFGGS